MSDDIKKGELVVYSYGFPVPRRLGVSVERAIDALGLRGRPLPLKSGEPDSEPGDAETGDQGGDL